MRPLWFGVASHCIEPHRSTHAGRKGGTYGESNETSMETEKASKAIMDELGRGSAT